MGRLDEGLVGDPVGVNRTAWTFVPSCITHWLRANGCEWDERTCYNAATTGQFHVLEWARNNGCPCNVEACREALRQWAREEGWLSEADFLMYVTVLLQ